MGTNFSEMEEISQKKNHFRSPDLISSYVLDLYILNSSVYYQHIIIFFLAPDQVLK